MRIILRACVVLCLCAGAALASLSWIERQIIYPFDAQAVAPDPAKLPDMQTWSVPVAGGVEISTWWMPPAPGKPVVVYLHGNAGNLAARTGRFQLLRAAGFGLLAPSYRGASGSGGAPSQPALTADTLQIWTDSLALPGLGAEVPRVLFGESLGTGVALALAAQLRRRDHAVQPRALVLEAPYLSMPQVGRDAYGLPEALLSRMRSHWNSAELAPEIPWPTLILHGTRDRVIPFDHGVQLSELLPNARLHRINAGTHANLWNDPAARSDFLNFIANEGR